jgi:hypothetical protein
VVAGPASVIAYLADFKLLGIAMVLMIPLLFLMRGPKAGASHTMILE